jgi:hypothetical protein
VKYGGMLYLTSTDGFCSAGAARQVVLTWHDTAMILAAAAWCPVGFLWPSSALHSNTSVGVICMLQLDYTCPNSPPCAFVNKKRPSHSAARRCRCCFGCPCHCCTSDCTAQASGLRGAWLPMAATSGPYLMPMSRGYGC